MTFSEFKDRLNWRIIALHFVATFFLILASRQFSILNDIDFIDSIDKYGINNGLKHLSQEDNFSNRLSYFMLWMNLSPLIGLLIAFVVSLIITIRNKSFWLNSLIVFITGMFLNKLGLFNNKVVDTIFFSPGTYIARFGLQYKFITNGTILALSALFILFNKWTKNFCFQPSAK